MATCSAAPPNLNAADAAIYCSLAATARNGTVVLTATDSSPEFEELVRNWACHLRRVGLAPLVWALDEATHAKLSRWRGLRAVYSPDLRLPADARANEYKKPSSEAYTAAVALKPLVIERVVRLGFDVLFLDVDIAVGSDPLQWLRRSDSELQVSLNYDDRPAQQAVTGVPDVNTGVLHVRRGAATMALLEAWAKRTRERHNCPRKPPLWSCGDQEQLTRLLKHCGWRPLSFAKAAALGDASERQRLACGGAIGDLAVDVLPPRLFASGQSSALWPRPATARGTGRVAPRELLTFHPNFGGFAGGAKKAALKRVRFTSSGGTGWCAEEST